MKLMYAASIVVPSRLANRIQILSMARELSHILGADFIFGIGRAEGVVDIGVPYVAISDTGRTKSWRLAWRYLAYAHAEGVTHLYCREEKLLFFITLYAALTPWRHYPLFCYEIHHLKYARTWWHRFMLRRVPLVVSITKAMRDELVHAYGYAGKTLVAHDAVDPGIFDISVSREDARERLGLPQDTHIIFYAGSLELWKGVGTFYESAAHLDDSYLFIIVGGKPNWVEEFEGWYSKTPRVCMLGEKEYATELPLYLKAADVAVLPNTGKEEISRICTSPLKLFAYMASRTPIVASDLPSLREVLNESNAVIVPPDDSYALADGIRRIVADPDTARACARKAWDDVQTYTWAARARAIITFLSHV